MLHRIFKFAFISTAVFSYSCSVSAQSNCNDSASHFEYQGVKRQCNWVANQNTSACSQTFVKSFCPQTCQACQLYACRDVGVPFYAGANKPQQIQCSDLNNLSDFKKNFRCRQDKYRLNCRQTCRVCAGQTSTLGGSPTPPPPPPPNNRTPPTPATPTNSQYCEDSSSFIQLGGEKRQCKWVSKNKNYCDLTYVKELCPKTCDACQFGCNDVSSPFYIGGNKSDAQYCYIIRNYTAEKKTFKCKLDKFRKNCRETCQVCARRPGNTAPSNPRPTPSNPRPTPSNPRPTPSNPAPSTALNPPPNNRSCEDSTSFIELKGVKRQCNYIGNKSTASCALEFVKRLCPKTCNACQFGCADVNVRFYIGVNKGANTCWDIKKLSDDQKKIKCGQKKFRQNCRQTCGVCDS